MRSCTKAKPLVCIRRILSGLDAELIILVVRTLADEKHSISGSTENFYRSESTSGSFSNISREVGVKETSHKNQISSCMYS